METKDLVKWGLILVAGYLVYKYLSESGMFGSLTGGATTQQVTGTTTTTRTDAGGAASTTGATGGTTRTGADDASRRTTGTATPPPGYVVIDPSALSNFAKTRMGPDWEGLLTISQWNWMVSQMTGTNQQADLSFGESVPNPISVADYIARRVRAGLSGLDGGAGVGDVPGYFPNFYNVWTT